MKVRIRQWLIDLIREAVRAEMRSAQGTCGISTTPVQANTGSVSKITREIASKAAISFEQMQEEAIKAQEEVDERRAASI